MPCYYPLTGWRSRLPNSNGKYPITFTKSEGYADKQMSVPCGQCVGCRLEHSRQWAVRCMHEAQMHEDNCFITLTYCDEKLPTLLGEGNLVKEHFQKFMKRLRYHLGKDKIKFYACGEYGDETKRPHYHACLFGVDFHDKILYSTKNGHKLYISKTLDELWTDPDDGVQYGFATIGAVTFETAAYVARYCMKKRKGKNWHQHYERVDLSTGEILMKQPEFPLMSRRPGLGRSWLEKYHSEVLATDSVVARSQEMKPPKYYDTIFEKDIPLKMSEIKAERKAAAARAADQNTLARLNIRGQCKALQIQQQLKKEL